MVHDDCVDSAPSRAFETRRVGAIRDHHHDCCVEAAVLGSVDQRLQIAAATGDEDP